MSVKCPKCQHENPDDTIYCGKCASPLKLPEDISITKTLQTPSAGVRIGSTFADRYRIVDELGRGGMGVVYEAEDLRLERHVALKFLPPELTQDEEAKDRFVLEAKAAAAISHPNICTIHEIDEFEGQTFIAMEFIEGQSLRDRVKKGPINVGKTLDIAIQAASGLEEAHKKGVIHRDIKSANIMVTSAGQAKIMDFGLAKVSESALITREGIIMGTVAYMSPEQARGEKVDHRTDIWSLGIVLYEMISGQLPFWGDKEASVLYSIEHKEHKPIRAFNPNVPPEFESIINRCLQKKPEARYKSAMEILSDLRKYQERLRAEEAGFFNLRSLLRRLRQPRIAVPTAIALIVIVASAVWYFNHQAKIRWAREVILPEVESLTEYASSKPGLTNNAKAFRLVESVEKYIPNDPKLADLLSLCSMNIDIKTEPSGAHIYMKVISDLDQGWSDIGLSPIEGIRVPSGYLKLRMEKEEYESVIAVISSFIWELSNKKTFMSPCSIIRVLDKKGNIPAGMVRIAGAETNFGRVEDFFIDKYEVTNSQYKEFIEAGGYKERKYWKNNFVKDGTALSWEEAMAEFVDQTGRQGPATWRAGDFPPGQENYPVTGVSWYEAAAFAEFAGKSLPTGLHWGIANGEYTPLLHRWGAFRSYISQKSNFKGEGPASVGTHDDATAYGAFDMGGNVREWCWNKTEGGRVIRGGAWNDAAYLFSFWSQSPTFDRSQKNGFRCVLYIDSEKIPDQAFEPRSPQTIDFYQEKPVPDPIFKIYKDQFSYDKTDLNARVESRDDSAEAWFQEKISFDAAYGNERMAAYLFLPKNIPPPYQTIIYFPGQSSVESESSQNLVEYTEYKKMLSFLVANGRAVLYPVYKGTFERKLKTSFRIDSFQHVENRIQLVKDFRRSVDYLETRSDIDIKNIAYIGFSWGTRMAPIILAVEDRLKTAILVIGGLETGRRPEVNNSSYVRRVKTPALLLNGRYDMAFPYETSSKPMFDLLGTPGGDKDQKLYDTDHFVPLNEYIKETLAWLDKYLGPVK